MRYLVPIPILLTAFITLPVSTSKQFQTSDNILAKARTVLSQIEGEITLPGLKQPVEVLRDRWGIPHIYAKNAHDLFFAQGFVAAQDRLFQLDLWRRVAVGETAEVLGERALAGDRFARLVKYRGDMEKEWQSYSPDTKEIATAFVAGINACIDHVGDRLPIEFQILGYRPKKWHPEDVLGRMAGVVMTRNFQREIFRAQLIAAAGLDNARRLAPTDPQRAFAPAADLDLKGIDVGLLADYFAATKPLQLKPLATESNNWVVAGARSASGKPLLANDPHRAIALPALRYLVHLNAPGWNVIGSGEPALPGISIGHNDRIAWGLTIVGTDQADVFVEQLNPNNHDEYRAFGRWERVRTVPEQVQVKGQKAPVEVVLRFTHHGPILHEDSKRHRAIALKWVGSEPGAAGYLGGLALCRAKDWTGFLRALQAWKSPSENIVYADVDGNIGWVAAALTPVREGYDGLLPMPGDGKYGWKGYLAVKDLPQEFNPARGYIATANHNILPPGYPHPINFEWDPGYRFARVKNRLEAKERFTLEDFQSIQNDITSIPGQRLVHLATQLKLGDAKLDHIANTLRHWDGVLSRESLAGSLYAVWVAELQRDFYHPRLPKGLHKYISSLGGIKVLLAALEKPDEQWFGKDPKAKRDALLRSTFARAVQRLEKKLGADQRQWTWGRLHKVTFRHPLATLGPAYAKAFNLGPVGRPGDGTTPNNTLADDKFEQGHGATYRELFDLADWDKGLATSAPGQSGQPGSLHYADLLPLWAEERYFPLAFSRKKVEEVTQHRLRLLPAR
jgi:penicillin amidase